MTNTVFITDNYGIRQRQKPYFTQRKTIKKPAPIAKVILDGDEENAIILDSNFAEDWGDCLYLEPILHHGEQKKHTVSIQIITSTNEDQSPFYLLSFLLVRNL